MPMKRFRDFSIFKKLVILFVAGALVLTFGVGYIIVNISAQYAASQIKERYSQLATALMNSISMIMAENYHNIKSFAHDKIFTNGVSTAEEITQHLRNEKLIYGFVSASYFNLNRIRIADTEGLDIGKQHGLTRYWEDVLNNKVSAGTDVRVAEELKIPIIYFASLVKNKEYKPVGVVVARYDPKRIYRMIKDLKEEGVHATLFDNKRNVIVSTCPELEHLELKGKIPESASVKSVLLGQDGTALEYLPLHKRKYFSAYAHQKVIGDFKGNNWFLLIAVDKDKVFAPIRKLKNAIFVALIIIVIVILFVSLLIARFITRPVLNLSVAVKHIAKGDLSLRIEPIGKDEVGELAASLNQMVESFAKARADLVLEKAYSENIISSMTDSLIVFNPDGTFRLANKAALDLLGYKKEELLGWTVKELFSFEKGEKERASHWPLQQIIEKGAVYNVGLTLLNKQGDRVPVNFSGAVIREGALITGVVTVIRDMRQIMNFIHDLEKKERELEERNNNLIRMQRAMLHMLKDLKSAKEDLERALSAKTDFTDMISHELRTPLSAIREGVSVVLDKIVGTINEEQKKYLEVVKNNVDRLARLISSVLDSRSLSSGKAGLEPEENDINGAVKEVQGAMQIVAVKKNLGFICQLDEALPRINFDRDKIIQVLTNLVDNALKFTEKGSVFILTSRGENYIQVTVKDTGTGIKKEDLPKLFQQFTQLQRRVGGTGLGLSICKQIIEMHRGKIWAESEFGKGSIFNFILPIKEKRV